MKLLAFDTATEEMSVAVDIEGTVQAVDAPGGARASAALLPTIMALLAGAGATLRDLDAIAFGRGPGAFTGLRTACSVAQGLAYGSGTPVLPIDSLLCVAEAARPGPGEWRVWSLIDARMNEIYAAQYQYTEERSGAPGWQVLDAPMLVSAAALNERWRTAPPAAVAGNALPAFGAELLTQAAERFPAAAPTARALLRLAAAAWARGDAVDPALALPHYLRDKVAQTTAERDAARAAKDALREGRVTDGAGVMSPPGRPKGEDRSAQHEGIPSSPPGRPKGEDRSAQHEGIPSNPPGRPKGDGRSAQHEGIPSNPPGRPEGEYRSAQHEGAPVSVPGTTVVP